MSSLQVQNFGLCDLGFQVLCGLTLFSLLITSHYPSLGRIIKIQPLSLCFSFSPFPFSVGCLLVLAVTTASPLFWEEFTLWSPPLRPFLFSVSLPSVFLKSQQEFTLFDGVDFILSRESLMHLSSGLCLDSTFNSSVVVLVLPLF